MALPLSGNISLNDIKSEFGASGTRSLTAFYRGGSFVPNTTVNSGVPTSGTIEVTDFHGTTDDSITIVNRTIHSSDVGTQTAIYELQSDGDIIHSTTISGSSDSGDWVSPKASAPGPYEVRATISSGSVSSGSAATGSWIPLTSTRLWRRVSTTVGVTVTVVLIIEIRLGSTVLDTATITLQATRTS